MGYCPNPGGQQTPNNRPGETCQKTVVASQRSSIMMTMTDTQTLPSLCAPALPDLLAQTSALHKHLCPRQVLGIRMGLQGGALLGLTVPQANKRLLAIVETDGCAADGVAVATGCWVGHRTLRVEDYGKVAATFVDTETGLAHRVWPRLDARRLAPPFAPDAHNRWESQLLGYQRMPVDMLLSWREVRLRVNVEEIISRPSVRAVCEQCGEEILNGREARLNDRVVCKACAGASYYHLSPATSAAE